MAIVLLVDPSQTIRRVVEMVFKGSGHDVIAAATIAEGRQALMRYQPSIAVINYVLPDGSGVQLCRAIKQHNATTHIPVVILGGSYAPFNEAEARTAGADAVVMKPFDTDGLYKPVVGLIEDQPTRRAAEPARVAPAPPAAAPAARPPAPPAAPAPPPQPRAEAPRYAPPSQKYATPSRPVAQAAPPASPSPQEAAPVARAASGMGQRSAGAVPQAPSARPTAAPSVGRRDPSGTHRAPVYQTETRPQPEPRQAPVPVPVPVPAPPPRPVIKVDINELREIVEDLLPQVAIDSLQKILSEWLEERLRNYIHQLVQQELSRFR